MKEHNYLGWPDYISDFGNWVKAELLSYPHIKRHGLSSLHTTWGAFGAMETNYVIKAGRRLLDKLFGDKLLTIHDIDAPGYVLRVRIHERILDKEINAAVNEIGKKMKLELIVEYA
ncbi:MAG: hypothetical protein KJ955_02595 [Nanoarchaeota archaeon]|nr:hypothetical protein [Nanoarchaeota archaeon]